jgi:hypothetical protein
MPTRDAAAVKSHWSLAFEPSIDWDRLMASCGGSFFHSPAAPDVVLPAGERIYARLTTDGQPAAIAVGVASACRLSRGPRHYQFAAMPAVPSGGDVDAVASSLARTLKRRGAAVVSFDSFDTMHCSTAPDGGVPARRRFEHVLELRPPEQMLASFAATHRRHINRGIREGWTFRSLSGAAANRLIDEAQTTAAQRNGFTTAGMPDAVARLTAATGGAWGVRCFAAYHEATALAAILVGFGGARAFYLIGGSTPAGYQASAAVWLQWQAMAQLHALGLRSYNLGGTPGGAEQAGHAEHGLFRFKKSFGGEIVSCSGARWELSPSHLRLHRVLTAITRKA